MFPRIIKSNGLKSKNLIFKEIETEDASFILNLRLDPSKNKFISQTSTNIQDQINWIKQYKLRGDEAYFLILSKENKKLGCIRIYDCDKFTYTWGSWLLKDGLSPLVALESALLTYSYGKKLGFKEVKIDVRKDNLSVRRFHEKFSNALIISESKNDVYYLVKESSINKLLDRYSGLLTN